MPLSLLSFCVLWGAPGEAVTTTCSILLEHCSKTQDLFKNVKIRPFHEENLECFAAFLLFFLLLQVNEKFQVYFAFLGSRGGTNIHEKLTY